MYSPAIHPQFGANKNPTPTAIQKAPNREPPLFLWSLMFGISLVLGAWDLELQKRRCNCS
jgi:hypothetical protein